MRLFEREFYEFGRNKRVGSEHGSLLGNVGGPASPGSVGRPGYRQGQTIPHAPIIERTQTAGFQERGLGLFRGVQHVAKFAR